MNYRHGFHAGNFADVLKHAVLARILVYLTRKNAALRVIETHAGPGLTDLHDREAARTGEWRDGVGRLARAKPPADVADLLAPYLAAIGIVAGEEPATYPGSPLIAQTLTRRQDRLTFCEMHEESADRLTQALGRDRRAKILRLDGYVGLKAFTPPVERRGLVLVDPPFEASDEWDRLAQGLIAARAKWPTGVYVVWFPLKSPHEAARLVNRLTQAGAEDLLRVDMEIESPRADGRLTGAGLLILNPPYTLEDELRRFVPWLAHVLTQGPGARWRVQGQHS